ncbi:hypothetical protein M231_03046 [Tremella mesenterica]|uniref:Uncharacterized protein n=1 Tax=Tremella mesenterica TaxID=5217 RepID=A0A4Q1BP82_TREME|nr:hypothetical protein M231_03046 [Tremella mesenterica]
MQLGRFQVSTLRPAPVLSITFSPDGRLFTIATETGYEIWRTYPLVIVRRRIVLSGTLALVVPLLDGPLLVLQGGGRTPVYSPNKVIIYHDGLGIAVAELEFEERVRNVAIRRSTFCVALSHRVIAFEYGFRQPTQGDVKGKGKEAGFWVHKIGEWETAENELGLMALSTNTVSTLLALPGRQPGHVQLNNLPPCPPPASENTKPSQDWGERQHRQGQTFRNPIILAHDHPLSTLACTANGSHILTTGELGTLVRVWDTTTGGLEREYRRGMDPVRMWGAKFEFGSMDKGGRLVGWSDKGTVHVFGPDVTLESTGGSRSSEGLTIRSTPTSQPSLTSLLSRNLPLPRYFSTPGSFAQYHLPRKNPHAFSSAISSAAAAARVPSMKMKEEAQRAQQGEWAERFVVTWIEVQIPLSSPASTLSPILPSHLSHPTHPSPTPNQHHIAQDNNKSRSKTSIAFKDDPLRLGVGMGNREERRSFGSGSDRTIRSPRAGTVTPTIGGTVTPTQQNTIYTRRMPGGVNHQDRRSSFGSIKGKSKVQMDDGLKMKVEHQLVVITHSGDWYRLRIPDPSDPPKEEQGEDVKRHKGQCELVEYRRLGVGGTGW